MASATKRSLSETEEARNRILDAAARAFATGGMKQIRMDDIAKEAGYSVASIYNYFKNKDDVLGALLDRAILEFLTAADVTVPQSVPPEAELEWLALRLLQVARGNLALMAFVLSPRMAMGADVKQDLTNKYLSVHGRFMVAVEERVARLPRLCETRHRLLAYQFVGILRTETFRWLLDQENVQDDDDLRDTAEFMTRFFLAGAYAIAGDDA